MIFYVRKKCSGFRISLVDDVHKENQVEGEDSDDADWYREEVGAEPEPGELCSDWYFM